MKFRELNVSPEIERALEEMGIEETTGIQDKAIPLIRERKDVIGMSKTGSGKTLAFGLPIIENIFKNNKVQVLILAPTRELALQISKELCKYGKYVDFSVATVFGGVAIGPQIDRITRSEIVVGTPGRVLDHLGRGTLNLTQLSTVVLDEADKMVDMGFIDDINRILSHTNDDRQILLFGATISHEIERLKKQYMKNPAVAKAEAHVQEDLLEQYYYNAQQNEKFSLLVHLLNKEDTDKVIIFCSTKATVNLLTRNLRDNGVKADMIHADLSQNKRMRVVDNFNNGNQDILVASAVAARGLDIKNVSHVFNYDLPRDPQEYIHRIGRTARAGKAGKAITLLSSRDHDAFSAILGRYDVNVQLLPKENFKKLRFNARAYSQPRRNSGFNRRTSFGRKPFRRKSRFRR